ncbi:S-layer homology domain-containing protein [Pelotomaculum isophthalicicum JI]|uniref:S-layer homology domain-containing protein n=1 Tax=Pelotomaculum isophthalicicum JI TaxID=947010 RepID=A0A9X4GZX0_9FIRM|nr:S-layer homology domain-containing protein [Pelotomaculum isophthalicicum]MDF9406771.1 S-layer homology domain-containing protein [Pelotomaculum isophthalicicum JI]
MRINQAVRRKAMTVIAMVICLSMLMPGPFGIVTAATGGGGGSIGFPVIATVGDTAITVNGNVGSEFNGFVATVVLKKIIGNDESLITSEEVRVQNGSFTWVIPADTLQGAGSYKVDASINGNALQGQGSFSVAQPAAPTADPPEGTYQGARQVTLSAEAGAKIYYTTDGSQPSTKSTLFTAPFSITQTTTVKAIAVKYGAVSNTAIFTYTITGGGVVVHVTGVTVAQTLDLITGDSKTLVATVSPANATNKLVTWTSDNPTVASVDSSSGKVTANSAGTANITVTTVDGNKTATCKVTVYPRRVTGVALDKDTMNLLVGNSANLIATVEPSNATNKNVVWSSSDPSVASVDSTGRVTAVAVKQGEQFSVADITVTTADGGYTAICKVKVYPVVTVQQQTQINQNAATVISSTYNSTVITQQVSTVVNSLTALTVNTGISANEQLTTVQQTISTVFSQTVTSMQHGYVSQDFVAEQANTILNDVIGNVLNNVGAAGLNDQNIQAAQGSITTLIDTVVVNLSKTVVQTQLAGTLTTTVNTLLQRVDHVSVVATGGATSVDVDAASVANAVYNVNSIANGLLNRNLSDNTSLASLVHVQKQVELFVQSTTVTSVSISNNIVNTLNSNNFGLALFNSDNAGIALPPLSSIVSTIQTNVQVTIQKNTTLVTGLPNASDIYDYQLIVDNTTVTSFTSSTCTLNIPFGSTQLAASSLLPYYFNNLSGWLPVMLPSGTYASVIRTTYGYSFQTPHLTPFMVAEAVVPQVIANYPANGATDVAVDATVKAVFDSDISAANLNGVVIKDSANNIVSGVSASIDANMRTLLINHPNFSNSTQYTVTIPANTVISVANSTYNSAVNWSFTTVAASGGGGGSSAAASVTTLSADDIAKAQTFTLKKGTDTVALTAAAWAKLAELKSDFTLKNDAGTVVIKVSPDAIDVPSGFTVSLKAAQLSDARAAALLAGAAADFKAASAIYEITATVAEKEKAANPATIKKFVFITMSYAGAAVDEDKLGAYWYNEKAGQWEYVGGKVNKADKTVTFKTAHLSKYALLESLKTFKDIADHWAKRDIEIMAARGVAKGMNANEFMPDATVTRAQFAALLARITGAAYDPAKQPAFADVPAGAWYAKEVAAAYAAGLIKGYDESSFGPDDPVTREQIAVMVVRSMNAAGVIKPLDETSVQVRLRTFSDSQGISEWARQSVADAAAAGIVRGYPSGAFQPSSDSTRAEGIVMLKRMMDQLP